MKFSFYPILAAIMFALCFLVACEDPTGVGSGLLGEEDLNLAQKEDFSIVAKTVRGPELITYTRTNYTVLTHLLGELNDPVFGKSSASFYAEVNLLSSNGIPDYTNAIVDSLIMTLELSTDGRYGDTLGSHKIEVFRLNERLSGDTIFSNQSFSFDPDPIGVLEDFTLAQADSVKIYDPEQNDTMVVSGAMRIKLSGRLAGQILVDSLAKTSNEAFQNLFNGFYIRSTSDNSVFGIDISGSTLNNVVTMYYRDIEDKPRSYSYLIRGIRPIHFETDPFVGEIGTKLEIPATADDVLYVQGMDGVNAEFDLSDVLSLKEEFINYAELEVTVASEYLGDTILYPLASQLSIRRMNESGRLVEIADVLNGRGNAGQLTRFFGGDLQYNSEKGVYTYKMNITTHIKQLLKDQVDPTIYLSIFNKVEVPQRVVIYGPDHQTHPISLKITYTKL